MASGWGCDRSFSNMFILLVKFYFLRCFYGKYIVVFSLR